MKKGKERKRHELVCAYSGDKFKSSKTYTRFSSSKNRFYFFAKKKVLIAYIQSQEVAETNRFNSLIQDLLKKHPVDQDELLRISGDHEREMHRLEGKRVYAEDILIQMNPSKTKLTKENLRLAMQMVIPF